MDDATQPSGLCECGCGEATGIADRNDPKWGWVRGQPVRFKRGHQGRGKSRVVHIYIDGVESKRCTVCGEVKPLTAFHARNDRLCGRQSRCITCGSAATMSSRRWYQRGISREQYAEMVAAQAGKCAICGKPETARGRSLSTDHDHRTGRLRALLCSRCNTGLGLFGDSVQGLESAIRYLRAHEEVM